MHVQRHTSLLPMREDDGRRRLALVDPGRALVEEEPGRAVSGRGCAWLGLLLPGGCHVPGENVRLDVALPPSWPLAQWSP